MQPILHPARPFLFTIDPTAFDREQNMLPPHLRPELPALFDNPLTDETLAPELAVFATTGLIPQSSENCAAAFQACLECGLVDQAIHLCETGRIASVHMGPLAYRRDIIEALGRGASLQELFIEDIEGGNQGHEALCEQFEEGNLQLTRLEIDDCALTREQFTDLVEGALLSGRLERLSLTGPGFKGWVGTAAASASKSRELTELRIDARGATAEDVALGLKILAGSDLPPLGKIEIRCNTEVPVEDGIYGHLEDLLDARRGQLTDLALTGQAFDNPSLAFSNAVTSETCPLRSLRLSGLDIESGRGDADHFPFADKAEFARHLLASHSERRSLTLDARLVAGLESFELRELIARTNLEQLVIEPLEVCSPNFYAIEEGLKTNHTLVSLGNDWFLRPSQQTEDRVANQSLVQGLLARNQRYRQLALAGTQFMVPQLLPHYAGLREMQNRLPNEVIAMIFDHLGNDGDPAFAASLMNTSQSMRSAFVEHRVSDWLRQDNPINDFKAIQMLDDLVEGGPPIYLHHPTSSAPPVPLGTPDVHAINAAATSRWIANPQEWIKPAVAARHFLTQYKVQDLLLKLLDQTGQPRQGLPDANAVELHARVGSRHGEEPGEPAAKVRRLND